MKFFESGRPSRVFFAMLFAFAGTIAVLALTSPAEVQSAGNSGCEGDVKLEGDGPHTLNAPDGQAIDYVCIKAGRDVFTFYCGETDKDGCYDLEWTYDKYGCCVSVTISGGGTGRDCKSISHVAGTFVDADCEKK